MSEHRVIINGKTFLYKQKAPFVPSGVSVSGALEYNQEEDKIRCHECGEWFDALGVHVKHAHQITAREYKRKHALKLGTALVNERLRVTLAAKASLRPGQVERAKHMRKVSTGHRAGGASICRTSYMEQRNERNTCPAQLPKRIQKLAHNLGRTPSVTELSAAGISKNSALVALNVPNLTAIMTLAGLVPNERPTRYPRTYLIEALRDFWSARGRSPYATDFRRGVLPGQRVYYREFGSLPAACMAAGIPPRFSADPKYREGARA